MANTANIGRFCSDPCQGAADAVLSVVNPVNTGRLIAEDGLGANLRNHRTFANAKRFLMVRPDDNNLRCSEKPQNYATVYAPTVSVRMQPSVGVNGFMGGSNFGQCIAIWNFYWFDGTPMPVDFCWRFSSVNQQFGFNERVWSHGSGWTDFYPGASSSVPRRNYVPANQIYADGNNGGSYAFQRHVTQASIRFQGNDGLSLSVGGQVTWAESDFTDKTCQLRDVTPGNCPAPNTAVSIRYTATPPDVPDFFSGQPVEISLDSGGTWNPAPASYTATAAHAVGDVRYRVQYTVPTGYYGHYVHEVDGTKYVAGTPGQFYLDTVAQTNPQTLRTNTENNNIKHFNLPTPVVAGAHTIEWYASEMAIGDEISPVFELDTRKMKKSIVRLNGVTCLGGSEVVYDSDGNVYTPPAGYTVTAGIGDRKT